MPDFSMIDSDRIKNFLPGNGKGIDIYTFDTIDSTNNEAKRLVSQGKKSILLICSQKQTAGRGRNGKSFFSPDKTGIYMSVVIHSDIPLSLAARATTAAAVAVCEAIEELTDKKPKIKWVNDIFLDNKKICGILTEAVSNNKNSIADSLIIGVGINVSTNDFPDELKDIAGSLDEETIDKNQLVAKICERILYYSDRLENPVHFEKYKSRCFVLNRKINYTKNGESFEATAIDIDENGGLIVKTANDKTLTLQSGEISVKIN